MTMEENTLHPARKLLLGQLIAYLSLAVAVVVGFESDLLEVGACAEDVFVKYQMLMLMEVLTICFIPMALKMFSLSAVRRRLKADRVRGLVLFGSCRLAMIGVPLVANTILYYMSMSVAYGYMAIIGGLCFTFVYPSIGRCINETNIGE